MYTEFLCLYFCGGDFSSGVRHFLVGDWCTWWWVDSSVGLLLSGAVLFYLWCSVLLYTIYFLLLVNWLLFGLL